MRPVRHSLREYGRGIIGGLMFSLPLLYTMEVWWAGFMLGSDRILLLLAFTMLLLLGYNTYAGVRPDETWVGVVIDSVEELGLGLIVSASVLYLLGRIQPGDSLRDVMGKITVEALLIAIGISVGTAQMTDDGDDEERGRKPRDILGLICLSACGAVVLATNIAITDEIVMIGFESTLWSLIAMVATSLVLSALVLGFSDLLDHRATDQRSLAKQLVFGTVIGYAVAFVVSGIMLYLFGRFDGVALQPCLAMTVVLAVAACMGSTAGRILVR